MSLISVLRKPWSAAIVQPPHKAFSQALPGPFVFSALDHWWVGATSVLLLLWLTATLFRPLSSPALC